MTGVEVCGAMKNVIAIVCGISAGTGAGATRSPLS